MLHLPVERLAELADTEPTSEECVHLEACAQCTREVRAYVALRTMTASEKERTVGPLLAWNDLRDDLAENGLLVSAKSGSVPARFNRWSHSAARWSLRAAASFALIAGGVAIGRATQKSTDVASVAPAPAASAPAAAAANAQPASSRPTFASRAEALAAVVRAQQDYQRAAAFLLASDTTVTPNSPSQYRERLAALDDVMGVTRAALERVPHDPVINSYYLATMGAREATLQQLQLALPAGTKIDRF